MATKPLSRVRQQHLYKGGHDGQFGALQGQQADLLLLTVPEIRRLLAQPWATRPRDPAALWRWSRWRRRHRALARSCHYRRRDVS